jgi:serine/threonine-protein kinase
MWGEIASGGMATVHLGRLTGPLGFARTVAIKRLRPELAADPELATMLVDEARLAGRVQHPNVVPVIDVLHEDDEVLLVMEYVQGLPLSQLLKAATNRSERLAVPVAANIVAGALFGLHAAHETKSDAGEPLGIVHRDVSPQNILVGIDGVTRVLDFGVAKAAGRITVTRENQVKGKLRYMAPEQVRSREVGPWTDVWSACVVLWEALTGKMLFDGDNDLALLKQVLEKRIPSPRSIVPAIPEALSRAVLEGLERDPAARLGSALELATRIERAVGPVSAREIAGCVRRLAGDRLDEQARRVAQVESAARRLDQLERAAADSTPVSKRDVEPASDRGAGSSRDASPHGRSIAPLHHTVRPTPRRPRKRRRRSSSLAAAIAVIGVAALGVAMSRQPVREITEAWLGEQHQPPAGLTPPAAGATQPEQPRAEPPAALLVPQTAEPATRGSASAVPSARKPPASRPSRPPRPPRSQPLAPPTSAPPPDDNEFR